MLGAAKIIIFAAHFFVMKIENVIFDFGGVLVDWNPRYLYKEYFDNKDDMEFFLHNICTDEWNLEQDRGRSLSDGTHILQEKHPEYFDQIGLYYGKWEKMLRGDFPGTVNLLYRLKEKYKLYGLSNWSAETFKIAYSRFPFFKLFDGIVLSGEEHLVKPDLRIYRVLLNRYGVKAEHSLYIDDNISNVTAAEALGMYVIHYKNSQQLEDMLNFHSV